MSEIKNYYYYYYYIIIANDFKNVLLCSKRLIADTCVHVEL